jgi:hypothetical protein
MANINSILSNLNTGYEQVTDLIPDKRVFVDDFDVAKNEYDAYVGGNEPIGNRFIALSSGKYLWVGIDGAANDDEARNVRRYNTDFTLDETFTAPVFSDGDGGFVVDVVELSDGKLVIVGNFTTVNGTSVGRIARLNANGSLDSSFNFEGVGFDNTVSVLKLLSDGSFLAGGLFSTCNGTSVSRLVKLNSNGSLNTSFSDNVTLDDDVFTIHVLSSGKVYVGGNFTNRLIELNSDGTTDETFDVGTGFNNMVTSIKVDSNNKVIVGGSFDEYDGSPCSRGIVRLNTNGTLDSGFETEGAGLNYNNGGVVQCLAIQSDGKIVVGGSFDQYDGNRQGLIIRFNTDGTKDSTFVTGYGFGDDGPNDGQRVLDILLNNNKIICVGGLYNYGGKALYGFAKLGSTGSLDPERLFRYVSFGINDGGNDMYDDGNFINTNLTQLFEDISGNNVEELLSVPNTHSAAIDEDDLEDEGSPVYEPAMDGQVMSGVGYFGDNSSYFTNYYPGMYVMVANNINIEEFSISGDVGSDDNTENESTMLVVYEGATYTVFVKVNRESSGGGEGSDPSVNHMIIVPGESEGLTQVINDNGDDWDDHCIRGLTGRNAIAYILVARETGDYLDYEDAEAIVVKFLEVTGGFACGENYELDLSPDNPETNPNYRFDGEGNMDTSVIVDPVTGKRVSIQRTGYFEIKDACGNRRVVSVKDGENIGSATGTWVEALGSIIKISEPVVSNDIRILINSNYVDYQEGGGEGQEPNNIIALMDDVNISYTTFTDISESSFANFSGGKIIIPELEVEESDLNSALTSGARSAIESFVDNGGTLIMFNPNNGGLPELLNAVFGFSLNSENADEPISLTEAGSILFPGESSTIPSFSATNSLDTSTLPPYSVTIYAGDGSNQSVVTMIPYGSGQIYVMGWDWYSAAPVGSQDGGWLNLLESILNS